MKLYKEVMALQVTYCDNHSFNHFKMVEVQIYEVDAMLTPFNLAWQWVGIV
jgi:hypothetical protein